MNNRFPAKTVISVGDFLAKYYPYLGWEIVAYHGKDPIVILPKELEGEPIARIASLAFSPLNPYVSEEQKAFLRHSLRQVIFDDALMKKIAYFPLQWLPLAFAGCKFLEMPVPTEGLDRTELREYPELLYPDCPNICPAVRREGEAGVLRELTKENHSAVSIVVGSAYHTVGACAGMGSGSCEVYLAEGVETIEAAAFAMMTNLTTVYLPSTLRTVAANAFAGCTSLSEECKEALSAYITPSPYTATVEYRCVKKDTDSPHAFTDEKTYRLTVSDVTASDDFVLFEVTEQSATVYLKKAKKTVTLPLLEEVTEIYRKQDNGSLIEGERYYACDETYEYTFTLTGVEKNAELE